MTNYDLIKNMSIDQMALIIMCPTETGMTEIGCSFSDDKDCYLCTLNWLKEEVNEH